MGEKSDDEFEVEIKKRCPTVIKNTTDLQRLKLEKLMKNPDKPIIIPERPKERGSPSVPDFVRNVMGSSAGAGSGEFHVYRHLRRKEYARQKYMKEKGERERLDDEYRAKLDENKRKADEKTAKKRVKRQKRKGNKRKKPTVTKQQSSSSSEELTPSEDEDNKDKDDVEKGEDSAGCNKNQTEEELSDKKSQSERIDEREINKEIVDRKTDDELKTSKPGTECAESIASEENIPESESKCNSNNASSDITLLPTLETGAENEDDNSSRCEESSEANNNKDSDKELDKANSDDIVNKDAPVQGPHQLEDK